MPEHIATRHKTLIMDSDLVERVRRICGQRCWGCLCNHVSNSNYCRPCRNFQDAVCASAETAVKRSLKIRTEG